MFNVDIEQLDRAQEAPVCNAATAPSRLTLILPGWICHCTDCQTLSGSVFRTVVPIGKPTVETPKTSTAHSGPQGHRRLGGACPWCCSRALI